jgi:hypothetical protein
VHAITAQRIGERRAGTIDGFGTALATRPFHLWFGTGAVSESRGLQHELNFDGFKGKNDSAAFRTLKNTGIQ